MAGIDHQLADGATYRRIAIGLVAVALVTWMVVASASVVLGRFGVQQRCRPSGNAIEGEWRFVDADLERRLPVPRWTCRARHVPTGRVVQWEAARTSPWRAGG